MSAFGVLQGKVHLEGGLGAVRAVEWAYFAATAKTADKTAQLDPQK